MNELFSLISEDNIDRDCLMQSLNNMSNLSKILDLFYGEHSNFQHQIQIIRILYLLFQSNVPSNGRLDDKSQLSNRYKSFFGYKPDEKVLNSIISRTEQAGWLQITKEYGFRLKPMGLRMIHYLFNLIQIDMEFQQKDDLDKVIFMSELLECQVETFQKLDIDNVPNLSNLIMAIEQLTYEVNKNISLYLYKKNAIDEIKKLQNLIDKCITTIDDYLNQGIILNKIDEFRLNTFYVNQIRQSALITSQKALVEVLKALSITASQIVITPISPDKFKTNLILNIRNDFFRPEEDYKSAYEIMILMLNTDNMEPICYLPNKIFGGISSVNIWNTICAAEQGDYGFEIYKPKNNFWDEDVLQNIKDPEEMSLYEILEIENNEYSAGVDDQYNQAFGEIVEFAIKYSEQSHTIQDWIMMLENSNLYYAVLFLDFISYLQKLGLVSINLQLIDVPLLNPKGWSFVDMPGIYSVITGREIIEFPEKDLLEENYKRFNYTKFIVARKDVANE